MRLSPLAKGAALAALIGGVLWIWGGIKGIGWMHGVGTLVFIAGAMVYCVERFRMFRRKK